jgi:hypothetical protein
MLTYWKKSKHIEEVIKTDSIINAIKKLQSHKDNESIIKNQLNIYNLSMIKRQKSKFISNISKYQAISKTININTQKLTCLTIFSLFEKQIISFKEWKIQNSEIKKRLTEMHKKTLYKLAFKGLLMAKQLKSG